MKEEFEVQLVRVYVSEADHWHGKPLYHAIVQSCRDMGISGAIVYRGAEGFGTSAIIHHDSFWSRGKHNSLMITIIDKEPAIAKLLPVLETMVDEGLIAITKAHAIRYSKLPPSNPNDPG